MDLPFVTSDLPGTGGALRDSPDDFEVEEIPSYLPCGEGDHIYAWIEKRERTTVQAVEAMAAALGVSPRDVGTAGLKDKRAVTRQQLSFPSPVTPEAVSALEIEGVQILSVSRHGNKLRTGHLRGNKFKLVVRGAVDGAADKARAVLARLGQAPGSPNWYGEQRFGMRGDNHLLGRALVLGERVPGRPPKGRLKRLLISAYQSHLFNDYLRRRIEDGLYAADLDGELMRRGSPSGPMFGHKMPVPDEGTDAYARERAILDDAGHDLDAFRRVGKLAEGTRRPIAVDLGETAVRDLGDGAYEVQFELPAGAYATAVMRELVKAPYPSDAET